MVSLSMMLQPISGAILIYLLQQQPLPTFVSVFGILLVIIGLLIIRSELNKEEIHNIIIDKIDAQGNLISMNSNMIELEYQSGPTSPFVVGPDSMSNNNKQPYGSINNVYRDSVQGDSFRMPLGARESMFSRQDSRYLYKDSIILI